MEDEKMGPSKISKFIPKTVLAVAYCALLLGLLEFGAQVYLEKFSDLDSFRKYASFSQIQQRVAAEESKLRWSPHRYLGVSGTPNYSSGLNRHNSHGYRGEEIADPKPALEFRIVALGGSTTYTTQVKDYRLSYTALLQDELHAKGYRNARVINGAASGYGSLESMISFATRILDLEPDLILYMHGINDAHPRLVWPPSAYTSDNSACRKPVSSLFMPSVWEHSTLIRWWLVKMGKIQSHSSFSRLLQNNMAESCFMQEFNLQKLEGIYPQGIFRKVSAMQMLKTNGPKFFARNVASVVAMAKIHGVGAVLMTFPYSELFTEEPRVSSDEYVFAFKQTNKIVRDVAAKNGVPLLDLAAVFPKDRKYFADGRHVTALGARTKAMLVADFLVSHGIVVKSK